MARVWLHHHHKACCKQQGVARGQQPTAYVERQAVLGVEFPHAEVPPDMPAQLGSLEHLRQVIRALIDWYNEDQFHVGLALLHPVDVHYGRTADIVAARQRALDEVHARHPERFVRGRPTQKSPPSAAWINPPPLDPIAITRADRIEEVAAH
jgi:hypothetical protein